MFAFAVLTGTYSYLIFFLGLSGVLFKNYIFTATFIYLLSVFFIGKKTFLKMFQCFKTLKQYGEGVLKDKLVLISLFILFIQILINLIGALGPELSFDALWYHLTLPKIYLQSHSISHIPGGLLYYSDMPKLGEMIYISALSFQGEILAKIIHLTFGFLSLIVLYKISRNFFSKQISLIVLLIFYANLIVGWESITAYIDLIRTFFEVTALWAFIKYVKENNQKWLILCSILVGFVITTKLIAIGSLFIFISLLIVSSIKKKEQKKILVKDVLFFLFFSLLIPLPWFIFSYLNAGNPVYPFFTSLYSVGIENNLINPLRFISDTFSIFTSSVDPVSPIYLIIIPLIIIYYSKLKIELKIIVLYSFFSFIIWYITPRTGGGRFLLPYLPAYSIVVGSILSIIKDKKLKIFLVLIIIIISVSSAVYRGAANKKYLPVILGRETKAEFLTNNLNFSYGDFYDTDGYFSKNIKKEDKVLLYGFHNLYYVNFPFVDSSWARKGETFNYIAVQDSVLPSRFKDWELVYNNTKTNVKLYSFGGNKWVY